MKKRVIVFSSHRTLESGGVGTHLKHLISEIKSSDIESYVLLGADKVDLLKVKFADKLNSILLCADERAINYFNMYVGALKSRLKKCLDNFESVDAEDIVVIHCHDKYTVMASYLLKDEYPFKIEIIQTLHAPFSDQYRITHSKLKQFINYSNIIDIGLTVECNKLIGVDVLQTEIAKSLVNFNEAKISNISNAIDAKQLDLTEAFSESTRKYFIVARHLHKKNGIIYAIQAFEVMIKKDSRFEDYDLVLMGDGPERKTLEKYVNDNGLSVNVKFIGKKDHTDSVKYLKGAIASVIPSVPIGKYIEATSLTMLESMYLGTPVIASNIGGLAEVLRHQVSGLLFEAKDFQRLAELMEIAASDIVLMNDITYNAKNVILSEFTSDIWFNKIRLVYEGK